MDGARTAAASQHFRMLFALAGCAVNPPAAPGKLERRASCAAETLHDISAVIGTLMNSFFARQFFTTGTG
jgi:hypothetical protein